MRPIILVAMLLLVTLPIGANHTPTLAVTEIYPTPDGDREFIELYNPGDTAIQLAGYTVQDNTQTNIFTFESWLLGPGEYVVVWGGGQGNGFGPAWTRSTVWNAGGDTVWVRDPSGALVAYAAYGGAVEPDGHVTNQPDSPDLGTSLQWLDGWMASEPTPGLAPDGNGGTVSGEVEEVPPVITLAAATQARSGDSFTVAISVSDDNGNLRDWQLTAAGALVAEGSQSQVVQLTVPSMTGTWALQATATDDANMVAHAAHNVSVRLTDLQITSNLQFPSMLPGQEQVTATGNIVIENIGEASIVPKFDISPLRHGNHTIPVDDNLILHMGQTAIPYTGPLTPLPELAPGASHAVTVQIVAVGLPLAAGTYHASFGVVA